MATRSKPQIVMLTTVHRATDVRIFHREAKSLLESGYDVTVIGPHGRSEVIDGVTIDAVSRQAGRLRRLLGSAVVLEKAMRRRKALFIFHDPELFWVGLALRFLRAKVIYDSHENLPMQLMQKHWLPRVLRWWLAPVLWAIEGLASRLLSGVIVVSETYADRFPSRKTVVVKNFVPILKNSGCNDVPIERRRPVVIYAGGLDRLRGISELTRAFVGLEDIGAELWLAGVFYSAAFEEEILRSLPPNVKFVGWKSYAEVLELYAQARIGAVLHKDAPNHRGAVPIKLLEYMAVGLPILTSNLRHFGEHIEGCGVQVDPDDVSQIRETIRNLITDNVRLRHMSENGRRRAIAMYSWESEGKKLAQFCSKLAANSTLPCHQPMKPS